MKNHKRTLRASEAEKIRKVLDNEYLILFTDVLISEDDVNDDPGDMGSYFYTSFNEVSLVERTILCLILSQGINLLVLKLLNIPSKKKIL